MHSGNFSVYGQDPELTGLSKLSDQTLTSALARNIDPELLDTGVENYSISNLRYKPNAKMVLGLTATGSKRPLSVRIFPPGNLQKRLTTARRFHPDHVFPLPEIDGLAWVFPAERKLNLSMLSDAEGLKRLLLQDRGFEMHSVELQRFVPEHTYTASVQGRYGEMPTVTEYLKIHYDDSGARTVAIMQSVAREIAAQKQSLVIECPQRAAYLANHRILLQAALPRNPEAQAEDQLIAWLWLSCMALKLRVADRAPRRIPCSQAMR